jgi:hypothetical protein
VVGRSSREYEEDIDDEETYTSHFGGVYRSRKWKPYGSNTHLIRGDLRPDIDKAWWDALKVEKFATWSKYGKDDDFLLY